MKLCLVEQTSASNKTPPVEMLLCYATYVPDIVSTKILKTPCGARRNLL